MEKREMLIATEENKLKNRERPGTRDSDDVARIGYTDKAARITYSGKECSCACAVYVQEKKKQKI